MALSKTQLKKFDHWLAAHHVKHKCPVCGNSTWRSGEVIASNVYQKPAYVFGGPVVSTIQLICNSCGYIMLFEANSILKTNEYPIKEVENKLNKI